MRKHLFMSGLHGSCAWSLMLTLIFQLISAHDARTQGSCERELAEAENEYYYGRFLNAVVLVENCLKKNDLDKREQKQAYELLAQIHFANNDTVQSKSAIKRLLEVAPDYDPHKFEGNSSLFIKLVTEVKHAIKPSNTGGRKWLWLGGAGGVAAITVVIALEDQPEEKGFVLPPGRP